LTRIRARGRRPAIFVYLLESKAFMTTAWPEADELPAQQDAEGDLLVPIVPRSPLTPLLFVLPTLLAALSWGVGGIPAVTDLSFVLLSAVCLVLLATELFYFPRRFGVGGILLYAGVLIWFSYDYLTQWAFGGSGEVAADVRSVIVAKAAFWHCLFIMLASVGLLIRPSRRLFAIANRLPEPASPTFYFVLTMVVCLIGISPYFIFTSEPWYVSIYKAILQGRSGEGVQWTVGRTGNVNYSWGGYVAEILVLGQFGGQLAGFYAILIARSWIGRLFCWAWWVFYLLLAFGTGTRGEVAYVCMPIVVLMFLKHQSVAAAFMRRHSVRAYLLCGVLAIVLVLLVQLQATFRTIGFRDVSVTDVNVLKIQGNSMFSEGLQGYTLVPEFHDYFYNHFPGEMAVRPMPQTLFNFVIGPIPRALWPSKPIDPVFIWYGETVTGQSYQGAGLTGTTITTGLVGHWYMRYGYFGVVEGALLFGWLLRFTEHTLQQAGSRIMLVILALGLMTWLFRCYRDFSFTLLYPLLIGMFLLTLMIWLTKPLFAGAAQRQTAGPLPGY
jgi:oligosaccharide repeat unit polymerase